MIDYLLYYQIFVLVKDIYTYSNDSLKRNDLFCMYFMSFYVVK